MSAPAPLDAEAVKRLSNELFVSVKGHYLRRPISRATAQEVLNACAIVVATIIAAARECDDEDGARKFFELSLRNQLDAFARDATAPEVRVG